MTPIEKKILLPITTIFLMDFLEFVTIFSSTITDVLQVIIAVLTIIYLLIKIKNSKDYGKERRKETGNFRRRKNH